MADRVQKQLESMLPALDDQRQRRLFSEEEIRAIVAKRTKFEYALERRVACLADYLRYLEYEMNLEALRRKRVYRKKQFLRKNTVSDYSAIQHVLIIFTRATRRFSNDVSLWQQFIEWAVAVGAAKSLARILPRALALHPLVPGLWIKAALYEFNVNGNLDAARMYFQRGLRLNETSKELWIEFFRMELRVIGRIAKRKAVLGFIPTIDELEDFKLRLKSENRDIGADDSSRWNPEKLLPLDDSDAQLLGGILPKTIFRNACQIPALQDDAAFQLSFLALVSEWVLGREKDTNIVQAMSKEAYNPKQFLDRKNPADGVKLNVECMLVAGVNIEGIYDTIFDIVRDIHGGANLLLQNTYCRSTMLLYNPVLPEFEKYVDSPYMKQFSQQTIAQRIMYTGAEAVAVGRFEECLAEAVEQDSFELLLEFAFERYTQYVGLLSSSTQADVVLKYINAYKYVIFETCRRAQVFGKCSALMFTRWLHVLYQFKAHRTSVLACPDVDIDATERASVDMEYKFVTNVQAVIEAAAASNVLNTDITVNAPEHVLQLWEQIILIFVDLIESLTGTEKSQAEQELKVLYTTALETISFEQALGLWRKYIQYVLNMTLQRVKLENKEDYSVKLVYRTISALYFEAFAFYRACRSNCMQSRDSGLSDAAYKTQQNMQHITEEHMNDLKADFLDFCVTMCDTVVEEDSRDSASEALVPLIEHDLTTLFTLQYQPQSLVVYLKSYNLEAKLAVLRLDWGTASKNPADRFKALFEKAAADIGSDHVEIWTRYLYYLIPCASTERSLLTDELQGVFGFGSPVMAAALPGATDEVGQVHWRATRALKTGLRSVFASQYDVLVHKL